MNYTVAHISSNTWAVLTDQNGNLKGFWLSDEFLPALENVNSATLKMLVLEVGMDEESAIAAYAAIGAGYRVLPHALNGSSGRAAIFLQ